jgi:hypothetical protein
MAKWQLEPASEAQKTLVGKLADRLEVETPVITTKGEASDQIEAFQKMLQERFDEQRAQWAAEREAQIATAPILTSGLHEFVGTILSTKIGEGKFGTTYKALIENEDGNRVWTTVPQVVRNQHDLESLKGKKVAIQATLTVKEDKHFAFASRPKMKVVA